MADLSDYRGVWVFCEQREGQLTPTDLELVSEARRLADDLGEDVCALVLGAEGIAAQAPELGGYGADLVRVAESPLLAHYTTEAYAKVVCDLVDRCKPSVVLFGASTIGRDLAPRCAARLHTGLTADTTHLDVDTAKYVQYLRESSTIDVDRQRFDYEDRNLKCTRPAFGGHLMATIVCPRFRPQMATVRPGVMRRGAFDQARADAVEVVMEVLALSEASLRTRVLGTYKEGHEAVDIAGADAVVTVGRGIAKDVDRGLRLAQELADELGGVVGATRAVVDAGWLGTDRQVGQTGKTVRPKLYVALGVSGAIQHVAGMQDSGLIVAVNTRADAPILELADYGIVGDLFQVVPQVIQEIRAARAQGEVTAGMG